MLTKHEKKAKIFADESLMDFWGFENILLDYPNGSPTFDTALEHLSQPLEDIVNQITSSTLRMLSWNKYSMNGKFAGKEFIENYVEQNLKKYGYPKTKEELLSEF